MMGARETLAEAHFRPGASRALWMALAILAILLGLGGIGLGGYLFASAHAINAVEVDGTIAYYREITINGAYARNELKLDGNGHTYVLVRSDFHPALPTRLLQEGKVQMWVDKGTPNIVAITIYDELGLNPVAYTTDGYDHPVRTFYASETEGIVVACVGGGSNSIGLFHPFLKDTHVKMIGVEAGGTGVESGKHAARFAGGRPGVLHGTMTYLLQDADGQVNLTHSVSAGLDYAAIGPEHSHLHDTGRVDYTSATDDEAMAAFDLLSREEGIIPALESSHAIAEVVKLAPTLKKRQVIIVNLSGRGDKDVNQVARMKGVTL
jgi:hypothetical protein